MSEDRVRVDEWRTAIFRGEERPTLRVSDAGEVEALAHGRRWRKLKPFPNQQGYLQVNWRVQGRRLVAQVSHLVLETFCGPCPPGMECRHLEGDNQDNRYPEAIAWGTRVENAQDRLRHGRMVYKLEPGQVREIRAALEAGEPQRKIAARYGVSQPMIVGIKHRKVWAWV